MELKVGEVRLVLKENPRSQLSLAWLLSEALHPWLEKTAQ